MTEAPTPTASPTAEPTATPTPPPAGSLAEVEAYCDLIDRAAVEAVLGAPISDTQLERSRSGGAWCLYATGDFEDDPGENVLVSFDRTPNLSRWTPGTGWDARQEYEARRQALEGRPQEIADLGTAAVWDRRHELHALVEPDVLLEVLFMESALDPLVGLAAGIVDQLAVASPPSLNPPIACRLLSFEDVEAATGRDVIHVNESAEFNPATTCDFSGPFPGFEFELSTLRIVLFRTEDIRAWLALDKSADFVPAEIRAQAESYTARQWLMDLGLYGAAFLIDGEEPGPKGQPIDVDGACAAYWFPGDDVFEPRFEAAFGQDEYLVLLLDWEDGVGVARQLAEIAAERLTTERGGELSPCG